MWWKRRLPTCLWTPSRVTTRRRGCSTPAASRKIPAKNRWPSNREAIPTAGGPVWFAGGLYFERSNVNEIIFIVSEPPEGGYAAEALGQSIFTVADTYSNRRWASLVR